MLTAWIDLYRTIRPFNNKPQWVTIRMQRGTRRDLITWKHGYGNPPLQLTRPQAPYVVRIGRIGFLAAIRPVDKERMSPALFTSLDPIARVGDHLSLTHAQPSFPTSTTSL